MLLFVILLLVLLAFGAGVFLDLVWALVVVFLIAAVASWGWRAGR